MVYIEPGADWWRDRQWRCCRCERWFVLDIPYRVIDVRGTIMQAIFRCPVCGRRNDVTRRSLDHMERARPTSCQDVMPSRRPKDGTVEST